MIYAEVSLEGHKARWEDPSKECGSQASLRAAFLLHHTTPLVLVMTERRIFAGGRVAFTCRGEVPQERGGAEK